MTAALPDLMIYRIFSNFHHARQVHKANSIWNMGNETLGKATVKPKF